MKSIFNSGLFAGMNPGVGPSLYTLPSSKPSPANAGGDTFVAAEEGPTVVPSTTCAKLIPFGAPVGMLAISFIPVVNFLKKIVDFWIIKPIPDKEPEEETERRALDDTAQKLMQAASIDEFAVTNLSEKKGGATSLATSLIWCDRIGIYVNPTQDSMLRLDEAGINRGDIKYVLLTESNDEVTEALIKIVLRHERIKVIASPEIYQRVVREANTILKTGYDEYKIETGMDHIAVHPGMPHALNLTDGNTAEISMKQDGGFRFCYKLGVLTRDEVKALNPLESKSILHRDYGSEREALKKYLETVSLLSHIDTVDVSTIADKGEIVEYRPGDTIIERGGGADCCYIILAGAADVIGKNNEAIWGFNSGDFFGEVGIQTGQPRSATIRSRTHLTALKINKDLYHRTIYSPLRGSPKFNSVKYALEGFFKGIAPEVRLSEASIEAIALRAVKGSYTDEIREGDLGNCAYILLDGEVGIWKSESDAPVGMLGAGGIFGEMALLNPSSRRTASVIARDRIPVEVLKINRELFEFILYTYPGVDHEVRRTMIARRRQNRSKQSVPRLARVPDYLQAGYARTQAPQAVYNRWRGFRQIFDIDFNAHEVSINELEAFSTNVEILHRMLRQILGETILHQRLVREVHFGGKPGRDIHYEPSNGVLHISKEILGSDPVIFAKALIVTIGGIITRHLISSELFTEETERLDTAHKAALKYRDLFDASLKMRPSDDLGYFMGQMLHLYIREGDLMRREKASDAQPELKEALKYIYNIFKDVIFLGTEFTREGSPASITSLMGILRLPPQKIPFDPSGVASQLEGLLNGVFKKYMYDDKTHLYRKIYEPELFNALRLELLQTLARQFLNFHIQKLTDRTIEISVYDAESNTRVVARFTRVKDGVVFKWRHENEDVKIISDKAPVKTVLVNIESRQFGGVRGTPENLLTIHRYLEEWRGDIASVSMYDQQWPENSTDALIEELKINTPDVVGLSATFGSLSELEHLLDRISRLKKRPIVVVGNLLSTWSYEYLLEKYPDIICVRFEGEEAMTKIIDLVARMPVDNRRDFIKYNHQDLDNIQNLAFSHKGVIHKHGIKNVDLSLVPPPDRQTLIHRQIAARWLLNAEGRGRGCGYRGNGGGCSFCTPTHGRIRFFPMERGLADFQAYMEAGIPFIVYVDEDFLPDDDPETIKEYARKIIELKKNYREKYSKEHATSVRPACPPVVWRELVEGQDIHASTPRQVRDAAGSARTGMPVLPSFYIAIRARAIYREGETEGNKARLEALRLLKEAGLVKIFLGAESGSPVQFHKTYEKGGSITEVERTIEIIRGEGVQVVAGFITFDPSMTLAQLRQDLDFMKRNGLVYVDPLTEPLNPFKYFRAQAGTRLVNHLRKVGLVSSSMDADLLSYDTTYRNPLIRMIVEAGNIWKSEVSKLDYHLKGIVWFAEQSPEEMKKASLFVELFNRLKQADFELIEAIDREIGRLGLSEKGGMERFLRFIKELPVEKALFELGRLLFPHTDVMARLSAYVNSHSDLDGFDFAAFLAEFLAGRFPDDFDFGGSNAVEYRDWLKDIRMDITHIMLKPERLASLIEGIDRLLNEAMKRRLELLERFAGSGWKDYYRVHPEAVRRGRDFEMALKGEIEKHRKIDKLFTGHDHLASPPFKIHNKVSLDDYMSYRHPDMGKPVFALINTLKYLDAHPEAAAQGLKDIDIYEKDGNLLTKPCHASTSCHSRESGNPSRSNTLDPRFHGDDKSNPHLKIAEEGIYKLFLNNLDPYNKDRRPLRICEKIYKKIVSGRYHELADVINDLQRLYRIASRPVQMEIMELFHGAEPAASIMDGRLSIRGFTGLSVISGSPVKMRIAPVSLDRTSEIRLGKTGTPLEVAGRHVASKIEIDDLDDTISVRKNNAVMVVKQTKFITRMIRIWRTLLDNARGLTEQERFNAINSLVEMMSNIGGVKPGWMDILAGEVEKRVSPMTLYLPDTGEYQPWQEENPDARIIYLHSALFDKLWPGVKPHLKKILLLARPELLDDLGKTLEMVRNGSLPPSWATFIYEVFFNRISAKAFLRNDDPADIVRNYTALSGRIMPIKTSVLLLNENDPRVENFEGATPDVKKFMRNPDGKIRFVTHPQAFHKWKSSGGAAIPEEEAEWGLVYPTSSARTMYVLGDDGDVIAKTHSEIWIGPAVRHLTSSNVEHSRNISIQIRGAIDNGTLPPEFRDRFAFIDDSGGTVINDPRYYPRDGSIGVINRSTGAYPGINTKSRVLMPAFASHNNSISVPDNTAPDVLVQLINHNIKGRGIEPIPYFVDKILKPLYKIFLYFMVKQGILLEPHGQNFFFEINTMGEITRLVFKDWQSTMVDMEARIRRGLPEGEIVKHILGDEAGRPLSMSLVFDYYFGTYLFTRIVDTLADAYHGNANLAAYKAGITAKFKKVFEEVIDQYPDIKNIFPDDMVRHGEKPIEDKSNTVYFKISGPPPFRYSSYERAIFGAINERNSRGRLATAPDMPDDKSARVAPDKHTKMPEIDLERTRLYVKAADGWKDARETEVSAQEASEGQGTPVRPEPVEGAYMMILPENFDRTKAYPVAVFLHGMNSDMSEVSTWADKIGRGDTVTVIPFAPFAENGRGRTWYRGKSSDDKAKSAKYIKEVIKDIDGQLNVGKRVIGGISQGGYMALSLMAESPELFDSVIAINTPFHPDYLGSIPEPNEANRGKAVKLIHLGDDQIVPPAHSVRAEAFFKELGFSVERTSYNAGQHNRLSEAQSSDINDLLSRRLNGTDVSDSRGHETALYETALDAGVSMSARMNALTALEKLQFQPIFDLWEDTTLLAGFRDARSQLKTVERVINFLTACIAHLGKEKLSKKELSQFNIMVSSLRSAMYQYSTLSEASESKAGRGELKNLINTIEFLHETALELEVQIVGRMK